GADAARARCAEPSLGEAVTPATALGSSKHHAQGKARGRLTRGGSTAGCPRRNASLLGQVTWRHLERVQYPHHCVDVVVVENLCLEEYDVVIGFQGELHDQAVAALGKQVPASLVDSSVDVLAFRRESALRAGTVSVE